MEPVPTVDRALSPSAADLPAPDPELMSSANTRSLVAIAGQFLYVAWLVALMGGGALGYALPSDEMITFLDIASSLVVLVMLLVWVWAAYKAAMQMSPEPLDSTPGWAVGVYFVPFANLWLPYVRMREIQRAAEADPLGLGGGEGRSGGLLIVWWIAWIGAIVLTRLVEAADPSVDSYAWIGVVGVTIGAKILTALVVFRLNDAQQLQAASRESGDPVPLFG